jgi:transcriptional regulator with XRE-family HTH domain
MPIEFKTFNNINQNSSPEKKKVTMEDIRVFGDKLIEAGKVINKNCRQISEGLGELGVDVSKKNIEEWEAGRRFPKEDKLEGIAQVLNIDLVELTKAFEISKEARDLEKSARNPKKIIPKRSEEF